MILKIFSCVFIVDVVDLWMYGDNIIINNPMDGIIFVFFTAVGCPYLFGLVIVYITSLTS